MNACKKTLLTATCLFALSCSGGSDSKKSDNGAADALVTTPTQSEPKAQGFRFVDDKEVELPLYVRGKMNDWLDKNPSEALLTASRLNFDDKSGCYTGTLTVEAGETPFRLAAYLPGIEGGGWSHLKVGLGKPETSTKFVLEEETKVDVYYFRAGDANGKDSGGGGNFTVNFPRTGDYTFKFCTQAGNYSKSFLTVSAG